MSRHPDLVGIVAGTAAAVVVLRMLNTKASPAWGPGWTWPIPDLMLVPPLADSIVRAAISQEFRGAGAGARHFGVDLMYRSVGDRAWFAPHGTPIVAAKAGTIWSVDESPRGWMVVIDHGPPWATFYQHLEKVSPAISKGARVEAGHQLGIMGSDPTDPERVRHLHFAAWYHGAGDDASVDPSEAMLSWSRWQWTPPADAISEAVT
jgi:murein DD-endopeptidase MepM/ murein hydrolase activator NlpD